MMLKGAFLQVVIAVEAFLPDILSYKYRWQLKITLSTIYFKSIHIISHHSHFFTIKLSKE